VNPFLSALDELKSFATKAGRGPKRKLTSEPMVERTRADLIAAGMDPDMVRSMMTGNKGAAVPLREINQAVRNRLALRAEPRTTPGPNASEEEWAQWGAQHGVNMTRTPEQSLGISDVTSRREIQVPGGLEGKFTIPDLFWLKGNNFDPNALPTDTHNALMQKFMRSYERPGEADPVDIFNALNFSLMSPNAPLTPNEFLAARTRVRNPDELAQLALQAGDPNVAQTLDRAAGVGAASRGGMGVMGTANIGNQPELASLALRRPDIFKAGPGEDVRDVTFRVMNQVPGLSQKTASLGTPFLDLAAGNTSAVDLHMIRNMYPRMLQEEGEVGDAFRTRMAGLLKVDKDTLQEAIAANPGKAEDAAINVIGGTTPSAVYRSKRTGELAAGADPRVSPERLAYEPDKITDFNPFYKRIMDYVDESRGPNPDLPLFMEQWRLWDKYRGRVEPHEFAHPDWRNLPKQSWEEMQQALQAHKNAGYLGNKPVMQEADWRQLYYGKADPALLAGVAGTGAAAAAAPAFFQNEPGDTSQAMAELETQRRRASLGSQMSHQPFEVPAPAQAVAGAVQGALEPVNLLAAYLTPRQLDDPNAMRFNPKTGQWELP